MMKNIDISKLQDNDINVLSMYLIFFADDMVLFTTDPESLQTQLSNLWNYSTNWGLKVNVKKTKLCIIENPKSADHMDININSENI
jgi:hypothetical protein